MIQATPTWLGRKWQRGRDSKITSAVRLQLYDPLTANFEPVSSFHRVEIAATAVETAYEVDLNCIRDRSQIPYGLGAIRRAFCGGIIEAMASQDPQGKRMARARAARAEEALQLLTLAQSRVEFLEHDQLRTALDNLRRDLRRCFEADESRGGGHLDPRRKYKGRSQHLALEHRRGVITLHLDESGKPERDLEQPHFVLAGVAMDNETADGYIEAANALKQKYGLAPSLCLHAPQIEKGVDDFAFGDNLVTQSEFRRELDCIVESTDFRLLGTVIRKDKLAELLLEGTEYPNLPAGLYEIALTFVAERFVDMLHADQTLKPCGRLVFESIGNLEDALHQRAFADLLIHGSEFVSDGCFRGWLRQAVSSELNAVHIRWNWQTLRHVLCSTGPEHSLPRITAF